MKEIEGIPQPIKDLLEDPTHKGAVLALTNIGLYRIYLRNESHEAVISWESVPKYETHV